MLGSVCIFPPSSLFSVLCLVCLPLASTAAEADSHLWGHSSCCRTDTQGLGEERQGHTGAVESVLAEAVLAGCGCAPTCIYLFEAVLSETFREKQMVFHFILFF